jgi:predicted acylesterase/phospholipase RssA
LRALAEAGVPIDYVAGTSMGAIIAAQFAADFAIDAMVAATRRGYVEQKGLPDFAFPSVALYSGRATDRKLKAMFGERMIEDLPIPYFAVAADLRRAESVVLDRGPVWRAARISTSIPGMLPPTEQDGRLLVDGGLLDNLPVEALRQRCGGRIVASDVSVAVEFDDPPSPGLWPKSQPSPARPGIAQIMMRTAQLASIRDSREAGIPADLYLNPQLTDVGMSDFGRFDEIVERGVIHARQLLEGWKA